MKNFGIILLCVLSVVFIIFYWNQDMGYRSRLQEDLAFTKAQIVAEEGLFSENEPVADFKSLPQDENDGVEYTELSEDLPPVLVGSKEESFDELERVVRESKNKFLDANFQFTQGKHQFSIPFFDRFAKFDGEDKKDIVYASLGYDIRVIKKLETLINKVDPNVPSYLSGLDKGIASSLLDILYNVTYYVREVVLNNHLNLFNLDKMKNNDAVISDNIIAVKDLLETLIQLREKLIFKLHRYIVLAESKSNKAAMEAELRKIIDQNGEIRQTLGRMMVITKTIEDLVNVASESQ
ncbi:hypothetical protein A7978_04570 (plasmid) [Borrelia turicatae]|uniref:Uncharacterized protein n=3 Tax=Borrelia turicatae TaxID=142 RepID=T1ECK7_BORT9|nr:hypothetical protein [Borrelia turicatae]ADN26471.1 hypothetical protein BTA042 [Borrelia turicatae 91E135]ANF34388.1 hypothetical protein A7978_04570 [Borrelia turicatae]UPA13972.1 hypothetical protein bt91E135_001134 [Borrelia turicatae 91E135]UPA15465.1 hypothetical protein btBTE5EL_001145 [Borrelia turicatae]